MSAVAIKPAAAGTADALAAMLGGVIRDNFTLLLSERQSHLGTTAHREAVIRRMAAGEPGAVMMDGKYFLTIDAHDEELAMMRATRSRPKMPSEPPQGGARA